MSCDTSDAAIDPPVQYRVSAKRHAFMGASGAAGLGLHSNSLGPAAPAPPPPCDSGWPKAPDPGLLLNVNGGAMPQPWAAAWCSCSWANCITCACACACARAATWAAMDASGAPPAESSISSLKAGSHTAAVGESTPLLATPWDRRLTGAARGDDSTSMAAPPPAASSVAPPSDRRRRSACCADGCCLSRGLLSIPAPDAARSRDPALERRCMDAGAWGGTPWPNGTDDGCQPPGEPAATAARPPQAAPTGGDMPNMAAAAACCCAIRCAVACWCISRLWGLCMKPEPGGVLPYIAACCAITPAN